MYEMDADNFTLLKFIQSKGKPKNKCLISWNYKVGLGGGPARRPGAIDADGHLLIGEQSGHLLMRGSWWLRCLFVLPHLSTRLFSTVHHCMYRIQISQNTVWLKV